MSTATAFRFAVNVTPKDGHPRSAGPGGRGEPAPPRGDRRVRRPGRPAGRADRRRRRPRPTARATVERLAGELLSNPLIEAYAIELLGATSSTDLGRVRRRRCRPDGPDRRRRLPRLEPRHRRGQRAPRGRRRAGRAVARVGRSRRASTAIVLPGGFAYGDYLRAGVIARFSPVMRAVAAFAADGGLVLGHLQRLPGPDRGRARCPGRSCATARCGSSSRRIAIAPERLDTPFTRAIDGAAAAADAGRPRRGLLLRRRGDARRARGATAGSCSATSTPTARSPAATGRPGEPERLAPGDRRGDERGRQRRRA